MEAIIISAHVEPKLWAVVCLSYEGIYEGQAPSHLMIEDVCCVMVGFARDKRGEYPIYLHMSEMTRTKQKFMLSTGFYALREKGYILRGA